MTPEQQDARQRRLVSAARALLPLQVGLYVGARRIENALDTLGADFGKSHRIFSKFTHAVPLEFPVGTARLFLDPKAVLQSDAELAHVEALYRKQVLAECVEIIKRYG